MPHDILPVLVIGAGPTGLTLACDIARRGIRVRIVDAASRPFAGSRGKGLSPRTLEMLDDLGVVDAVLAAGTPYPSLRLHWRRFVVGRWTMMKRRAATPDVPHPNPWLVPQARTEGILRDRLASLGVTVESGTSLTGFTQDDTGVTATLTRDGVEETVRTQYLVGADGGHSRVRKELGLTFHGVTHEEERMVVGDVSVEGLEHTHWHIWPFAKGGAVSLCPLPGAGRFQLALQVKPGGVVPELTEAALQQRIQEAAHPGRAVRLHDASWLSLYRPNVRMADRYRVGRVFIAGDAAHVHPPTGGQGLNTGVQDAYNLGWKLGHVIQGADPALLDTYEAERLPIAARVLGLSSQLFDGMRQGHMKALNRGDELRQLGLSYRGGPLAKELPGDTARVQAGDRAPDAPCVDAHGKPVRLSDRFRGPHWTLLAFGAAHAEVSGESVRVVRILGTGVPLPPDALVDTEGHAHRAYDVVPDTGALILVRPDGYVGHASRPGDPLALERFLTPLLPRDVTGGAHAA
ncbi:3-(3-hydroxyphenyl)propionate hydroxylase [Corallococcus sp. AB049A]|uniref:3-(3-hydroxyphenyl)propionate hydroxylase n=1 Tax=Corallococcus interemptor TaxID=2316720 RepID=A0A3A8QBP1_9BACT|nr:MULTISPECIES: FAD-dependent oxidoreductase [Corallococcus]RKH66103.1 3-(3-hydroxyphenyl)propionate hydroxylase [Corallococcus interemptor]RKI74292.1 3-(3-hydroxyphenyl)propionate hydroxylase [Corallococcus sp. AB049A]